MAPKQRQQQPEPPTEQAILAALVVVLLSGLPPAAMAGFASTILGPLGISARAAEAAIALIHPHLVPVEPEGGAAGFISHTAPARQAAYVLNAAKRLAGDLSSLGTEYRYLRQHLAAERGRRDAARATDQMAERHGGTVGWYAILDDRTSPGCRRANGLNFIPTAPPLVEGRPSFPGAVHLHCRCLPGAPHPARVPAEAVLVGA